jgi:hypothetical protein
VATLPGRLDNLKPRDFRSVCKDAHKVCLLPNLSPSTRRPTAEAYSSSESYMYMISYIFGGAVGGAALFALVSGTRKLIPRAK